MNRKANSVSNLKLWYVLNKKTIFIISLFIILFVSTIFFSQFGLKKNTPDNDVRIFTESTKIINAEYEKIYGYARLDSAQPPVTAIKVKYTYNVDNDILTGEQTILKRNFKGIMKGVDDMDGTVEVRYIATNPKKSIICIKKSND